MKLKVVKSYWRVWSKLTAQQFESQIANARGAALLFIFGKLFRLGTAFLTLYVVVGRAKLLAGYSLEQAIFILALFNFASSLTQMFMRGIYMFRQKVIDGTFDFYLLNPLSELFYSLFSFTDPMDLLLIIPYSGITVWAWINTGIPLTVFALSLIILIFVISSLMILAWNIIILGIGIRYLEVDNTIMLYRDLEKMGAFPTRMYGKTGELILTYIFPFALIATIPANLVFGSFNPTSLFIFALIGIIQLKFALWYWHRSLLQYSSASS